MKLKKNLAFEDNFYETENSSFELLEKLIYPFQRLNKICFLANASFKINCRVWNRKEKKQQRLVAVGTFSKQIIVRIKLEGFGSKIKQWNRY